MSVRIVTERGTVQHGSAICLELRGPWDSSPTCLTSFRNALQPCDAFLEGIFRLLPIHIRTIGPVSSAGAGHIKKSAWSRTANFSRSDQTKPMLLNHLVRILGTLKSMSFNSILGFSAEITAWSNALPFASRNKTLQWFTSFVVATILIKGVNGSVSLTPVAPQA